MGVVAAFGDDVVGAVVVEAGVNAVVGALGVGALRFACILGPNEFCVWCAFQDI